MYSNVALSIGGSDSGGGAGIQADLRTFMALKIHGCSAITCITAQNSVGVNHVESVDNKTLISQIESLFSDFEIKALKTGMLLNQNIIANTAEKLNDYDVPKIIDPVMVSRTGATLLEDDAINAYKKFIFPQAEIITPNIFEANILSSREILNKKDIEDTAKILLEFGSNSVLIKGGGLADLKGQDFFFDKTGKSEWLAHKFIKTNNTHGSGCTLSASICGYRSLGFGLLESVKKAKLFIERSLEKSYKIGNGPGPLGHYQKFK